MGCEAEIPVESVAVAGWKYLKILVFCRFLKAFEELAGRQGVSAAAFRNPNEDWPFQRNSYEASE